jgi:uncharacterized protein (TIGR03790 family)
MKTLNDNGFLALAPRVLLAVFLALTFCALPVFAGPMPMIILPRSGLTGAEVAVVVNENDPQSVDVGLYYLMKRSIPKENLIRVRFDPTAEEMDRAEFERVKAQVDAATPKDVQAFALTWTRPFRVGCMSVTTAFAFGYDQEHCASGCTSTRSSPYYNSDSRRPYDDHGMRPAMLIAGKDAGEARRLIDRGVASDGTWPEGTGYLVETSDANRNVRAAQYRAILDHFDGAFRLEHVRADALRGREDVMFYFTGLAVVEGIDSNRYLPGAVADHLTSTGGVLTSSGPPTGPGPGQMSVLRWLEAGATGSFGAVVEPCNVPTKFPQPGLVMARYLRGETLIEAYWKSVVMPGQSVFVGEPLANPFGGHRVKREGQAVVVRAWALPPGVYALLSSESLFGEMRREATFLLQGRGAQEFRIEGADKPVYMIVPLSRVR